MSDRLILPEILRPPRASAKSLGMSALFGMAFSLCALAQWLRFSPALGAVPGGAVWYVLAALAAASLGGLWWGAVARSEAQLSERLLSATLIIGAAVFLALAALDQGGGLSGDAGFPVSLAALTAFGFFMWGAAPGFLPSLAFPGERGVARGLFTLYAAGLFGGGAGLLGAAALEARAPACQAWLGDAAAFAALALGVWVRLARQRPRKTRRGPGDISGISQHARPLTAPAAFAGNPGNPDSPQTLQALANATPTAIPEGQDAPGASPADVQLQDGSPMPDGAVKPGIPLTADGAPARPYTAPAPDTASPPDPALDATSPPDAAPAPDGSKSPDSTPLPGVPPDPDTPSVTAPAPGTGETTGDAIAGADPIPACGGQPATAGVAAGPGDGPGPGPAAQDAEGGTEDGEEEPPLRFWPARNLGYFTIDSGYGQELLVYGRACQTLKPSSFLGALAAGGATVLAVLAGSPLAGVFPADWGEAFLIPLSLSLGAALLGPALARAASPMTALALGIFLLSLFLAFGPREGGEVSGWIRPVTTLALCGALWPLAARVAAGRSGFFPLALAGLNSWILAGAAAGAAAAVALSHARPGHLATDALSYTALAASLLAAGPSVSWPFTGTLAVAAGLLYYFL